MEREINLQLYKLKEVVHDDLCFIPITTTSFRKSKKINSVSFDVLDTTMKQQLSNMLNNDSNNENGKDKNDMNSNIQLLFRKTRDGGDSKIFHHHCDNKGPTITVIKDVDGNVFGGYTQANWDSSGRWEADPKAFIFRLENANYLPAKKFNIKAERNMYAILNHSTYYSPQFGDFYIYDKGDQCAIISLETTITSFQFILIEFILTERIKFTLRRI
jgi:hypothetical protein